MSLEGWKSFFEMGGVVLLFLTFVFGAGALITTRRINVLQAKEIRESNERIAGLEGAAANAKAAQQNVEIELGKQQERAAKAELALLELQERLAHRRIDPNQHNKFVVTLSPYRGSVVRLTKLGDSEAAQFADDILSVLHDAGWNVSLSVIGTVSPPQYGLQCSIDEGSIAGQSLVAVLRQLPTANVRPAHDQQVVGVIFVGLKPAP